ncbi:hypothetical protein ACTFH7_02010 [Clostridium cagae]
MLEEKKTEKIDYRERYGDDFSCPDCGRNAKEANIYDAGNGFCQDCAPEH